jgi:hypothetical protein
VDDEFWGVVSTSLSEDVGSVVEPSVSEEGVEGSPELVSSVTGLGPLLVVCTVEVDGAVPDGSVEFAVLPVVVVFVSLPTGTGAVLFDAVPQAPNTSVIEVRRPAQPIDRVPRTENPFQDFDGQ